MTPDRRSPRDLPRASGWLLAAVVLFALCATPLYAVSHAAVGEPLDVDDLGNLQRLQLRAEAGDSSAAFLLGVALATGRVGLRDDSEAQRWFRQAAGAGLPLAQYNLGLMLAAGRGGERNLAEALRWYEAAGEQDMAPAQFNAGMLLVEGAPGVPADIERGVGWLRRAAGLGLARAQYNLGVLREFGRGMPRDLNAAGAWYQRAARQGYAPAQQRLTRLYGDATPPSAEVPTKPAIVLPSDSRTAPAAVAGAVSPGTAPRFEPNLWVLARDPARYTLQLFSSRDEKSVREYLARHDFGGGGGYFRSLNDGNRWFSVVYGDYHSHAAAEQAGRNLPAALGADKPWVRNFGAIQQALER